MKELSPEERERLKAVLHLDDPGVDEWLAQQEHLDQIASSIPTIQPPDLTPDECAQVDHQAALMSRCWHAADAIVQLPSNNPAINVESVWGITARVAIQIHAGVMAELNRNKGIPK